MPWVRIDDSFHSHPKVLAAGVEAAGLYVLGLTYAAHHMTDGHVPAAFVRAIAGRRAERLAGVLVKQLLWEPNGGGWVVHDYHRYQPSRAQIVAKRHRDSARKRGGT